MSAIEGWSRLQTALTASSWDWLVPGDPLCCYGVQATRFARTAYSTKGSGRYINVGKIQIVRRQLDN